MSVREFAAHLGVSDRMVSKWEAGGETVRPRPLNQAALDTSLAMASTEVRHRFTRITIGQDGRMPTANVVDEGPRHLLRHPIDGKLMTMIEQGPWTPRGKSSPIWLPGYYIDVHPTTNADYSRFVDATDYHPPPYWAGRLGTAADDPVVGVKWDDVVMYQLWAAKSAPSADEWDRAARGSEGMVVAGISEWCRTGAGPGRRGHRTRDPRQTGFRSAVPSTDLLALLAI